MHGKASENGTLCECELGLYFDDLVVFRCLRKL